MVEFPQVLKNVRVGAKERLADADGLWDALGPALREPGPRLIEALLP